MKQYFNLLTNWRCDCLILAAAVIAFLLLSDADTMTTFLVSKAAGFCLLYLWVKVLAYWDRNGSISDLSSLADEE